MSISALLSAAEEPSVTHNNNNNTPTTSSAFNARAPVSPSIQRHHVAEMQSQRSPENRSKHAVESRPVASTSYNPTYDADATDSDHEPAYQAALRKHQQAENYRQQHAFRDFKYHGSMNVDATDAQALDEYDTVDDDSDEFVVERMEYMENVRKRQINLEAEENEKRKASLFVFDAELKS